MIGAALALLVAAAPTASPSPLGVRTLGTIRELFLDPTIADARGIPRPEVELRWSAANTWSTPTLVTRGGELAELQTDEQSDTLTLRLGAPWSSAWRPEAPALRWIAERTSTSVELRLTQHWGGWSDQVITVWHDVIRAFNYQRERYTWDDVRLRLGAPGARGGIDVGSSRLVHGDVVARTQVALARGGIDSSGARPAWGVAMRLDVKAPTGRFATAGGSQGWDGALALLGTTEIRPWLTLHGMLSASAWAHLPPSAVVRGRRWHGAAEISAVLRHGAWALVVEDRYASPALEAGWAFVGDPSRARSSAWFANFRPQNQLSFGVRRGGFTVWASEDVTPGRAYEGSESWLFMSNAPDIALGVAWVAAL